METNNVSNYKSEWWKWLLVPFASVIGAYLCSFIFVLLQWLSIKFMGGNSDGWLFKYIVPFMSSGVFGFAFVWCACNVAPKCKAITGIVMATLLVILMIITVYFAFTNINNTRVDIIISSLQAFAASFAAIATVKQHIQDFGYN